VSSDRDDETPALGALKDLLQSDGWQLFQAWVSESYGPAGYGRRMNAALAKVPHGPDRPYEIARVAEEIDATARAVNEIMGWPAQQIKALSPEAKSRRPFAGLRRA